MAGIFFVYGLAFFLLGFGVLLYPKKGSSFALGRTIWLLGVFGLLHGANEWLDMYALLQTPPESPWLSLLRALVLAVSFAPLVGFGLSPGGRVAVMGWATPALLLLIWGAIAAISPAPHVAGSIWARYLFGVAGPVLTAWRLFRAQSVVDQPEFVRVSAPLRGAAGAFFIYGALVGLVVPEAHFFPASVLNTRVVLEATGVPVQLLRAACAVVIFGCVVFVLRVFALETNERLRRARDELDLRVLQRTAELEAALSEIKVLRGLVRMCAWCRRFHSQEGGWVRIETYLQVHTEAEVTHGICPDCQTQLEVKKGS